MSAPLLNQSITELYCCRKQPFCDINEIDNTRFHYQDALIQLILHHWIRMKKLSKSKLAQNKHWTCQLIKKKITY